MVVTIRTRRSIRACRLYVWRWVWLALVTAGTYFVYVELLEYVEDLTLWVLGLDDEARPDGLVGVALKGVAGFLFWWRVVKVTVFLGSPLSLGLGVDHLRENGAENGRPVTIAMIDDPDLRGILFGVVARSHPRSDKVVRSRVEAIIMALPFGWCFAMRGSRFDLARIPIGKRRGFFFECWRAHHRYTQDHDADPGKTMAGLIGQSEPPRNK